MGIFEILEGKFIIYLCNLLFTQIMTYSPQFCIPQQEKKKKKEKLLEIKDWAGVQGTLFFLTHCSNIQHLQSYADMCVLYEKKSCFYYSYFYSLLSISSTYTNRYVYTHTQMHIYGEAHSL